MPEMSVEIWAVVLAAILGAMGTVITILHHQNREDHKELGRRIGEVSDHLNAQDSVVSGLQATIVERVKSTDTRFDSIDERLDRGQDKMSEIKEAQASIRESLGRIEGKLESKD